MSAIRSPAHRPITGSDSRAPPPRFSLPPAAHSMIRALPMTGFSKLLVQFCAYCRTCSGSKILFLIKIHSEPILSHRVEPPAAIVSQTRDAQCTGRKEGVPSGGLTNG